MADGLAVYSDALVEVDQVRRRVESHLVAAYLKNGGQGMRHRPLAVGTSNMDGLEAALGVAQVFVDSLHRSQSGLVARLSLTFVVGCLVEQVFAGLFVGHHVV